MITYSQQKIARILRCPDEIILNLEQRLNSITSKSGILDKIIAENDIIVERVLNELGLTNGDRRAENVHALLIKQIENIDSILFDYLGKPDLGKMHHVCGKLCATAEQIHQFKKGTFVKRQYIIDALNKFPPNNMLEHFKCKDVNELIYEKGFESVFCALRFVESQEWMHEFFKVTYENIRPENFEERLPILHILETEWLGVAEKFLKRKYHNVSHLKELGIIFVIPLPIDTRGETVRLFSLILHYMHEVEFYSDLFKQFMSDEDFSNKIQSLLRGDVIDKPLPDDGKLNIRIVQRYLAKSDDKDFRLFEPHLNPEAEHWYAAERDFGHLSKLMGREGVATGYWTGLDFVGDFFKDGIGGQSENEEVLISFDLIDLAMSLVDRERIKYLYHQQEALWNKIFFDYFGYKECNTKIRENMFKGYITFD